MTYAVMASAFLLTVSVLGLVADLLTSRQRHLDRRLRLALSAPQGGAVGARTPRSVTRRRGSWRPSIALPDRVVSPQYLEKVRGNLVKAGVPLKPQEFLSISAAAGGMGLVLGVLLTRSLLLAAVLGVLGLLLPQLWVSQLKQQRINKLEGQLLDALLLLANSMRAGHSFLQAVELVSRETPPPLSVEFAKVLRETKVGVAVEDALTNMAQRVDSKDVELVITGVLIQRQVGGNLAEVLDSIAHTIEKRIKMKAKIRALTAQGRLSAWVISLLPIGMAAFIFGAYPEYGSIMLKEPAGVAMLGFGAVMMGLGILLIRKVVSIDV